MNLSLFLRRCAAFLLDLVLIKLLTQLILLFMDSLYCKPGPTGALFLFSALLMAYSLLCATQNGKSVGREGMRIQTGNRKRSILYWFFRDFVLQWGICYLFPLWILLLFHKHHISETFLLVFFLLLNLFFWLLMGKTFADTVGRSTFIKRDNGEKKLKRTSRLVRSSIIDFSLIYGISLILNRLLLPIAFVETLALLWITGTFYYTLCCVCFGCTPGEIVFGIRLLTHSQNRAPLLLRLKRELLFKTGLGYFVPALLLYLLGWDDIYFISLWVFSANFFCWILYYSFKKEHWADTLAGTHKASIVSVSKQRAFVYMGVLSFWGISVCFLMYWSNPKPIPDGAVPYSSYAYPFQYVEYPANRQVEPYTRFLSTVNQSPKEYILDLFKEKDVVILCESFPTEDTQWEMIYDLVSDPRFIQEVGNVFNVSGSVHDQAKVDSFLNTTYANDTLLEKATATLMLFNSGNFYYYLKKLNLLNQSLPDSLKIREHFMDILPYPYLFNSYYDPSKSFRNHPLIPYRDSLMAQVVIDWHTTNPKKKCLVTCLSPHALMIQPEANTKKLNKAEKRILKRTAQYIQNAFPERTANVLLYQSAYKRHFFQPIQKGKWRTALKTNFFKPVGFSLKDTPFGEDSFDRIPTGGKKTQLQYQDLFTGFVFYKPEEAYRHLRPRYAKYAAELELQYALEHQLVDPDRAQNDMKRYVDFFIHAERRQMWFIHDTYNYYDMLLFALLTLFAFLLTV